MHPLSIGQLHLKNNLIAAPMAGLSSLPYRLLAIQEGAGLVFSEMISAEGIIRAHSKTRRYFLNDERIRPFGAQIFGATPEAIALAIKILEYESIDLIDINMGCPVKKVCSRGAGAALMRTPKLVEKIVSIARKTTSKPLTIKIRAGWDKDSINCVQIARIAELAGADAVTVHARTKEQGFKGIADWSYIADVKAGVQIPVIGNGDVKSRADALRMISETRCDGVMVGRAAIGNPWIFSQILNENHGFPTHREKCEAALNHLRCLQDILGEKNAVLSMRTMLSWYGKGIRGVKCFMTRVHQIKKASELSEAIKDFFKEHL